MVYHVLSAMQWQHQSPSHCHHVNLQSLDHHCSSGVWRTLKLCLCTLQKVFTDICKEYHGSCDPLALGFKLMGLTREMTVNGRADSLHAFADYSNPVRCSLAWSRV